MTRIFLVSRCGLLGGGLESLLAQQPGMEIVGRNGDVDRALEEIGRLHPEVVILGDCDAAADVLPVAARILQVQTDIRVVSMNSRNETLEVYSGERRAASDLDSLLAALTGEAKPNRGKRVDRAA